MICLSLPQQAWLQSLMSHRIVTEEHAQELLKSAARACQPVRDEREGEVEDGYAASYTTVSRALNALGFDVRRMVDEATGTTLVALVNTKGDSTAQLATQYSSQDMTFVKGMVRAMIQAADDAFCISAKQASNLGRRLEPPYSSRRAKALSDDLVRHGWLREDETGHLSMTVLSLLELQSYLQAEFEDQIHSCNVCHEICTKGSRCSVDDCDVYVHKHCQLRFEADLKRDGDTKQCKVCGNEWKPQRIGVATEQSDRARPRAVAGGEIEDGEEDEEQDDEDEKDLEYDELDEETRQPSVDPTNSAQQDEAPSERTQRGVKREQAPQEIRQSQDELDDAEGSQGRLGRRSIRRRTAAAS